MQADKSERQGMNRANLVRQILDQVDDDVVLVSGIGNASFELGVQSGDRGANFYMLGSMGQAFSIGLGLAIAQPDRKVVVMEGDGSILLNLSAMVTVGSVAPENLTIVIWDNEQWQITGGQPTATANSCELAIVAHGCGVERARTIYDEDEFGSAFRHALNSPGPNVLVAKIDNAKATSARRDDPIAIKLRFMEALDLQPD